MSIRLTPDLIADTATAAGYEPRAVRAIIKVETGGSGYDKTTGWLLIQFEPAWFRRLCNKATLLRIESARLARNAGTATPEQAALIKDWEITQTNQVEGQLRERLAFDAASRIDKQAAQLATSWGLPQMMGFNHKVCGYASVEDMVEAFRISEANQLAAMLKFISANPKMKNALRTKEWPVLAYYYNGAGYKQFNYDRRLAAAYESLS
jgi:hypothetical protein